MAPRIGVVVFPGTNCEHDVVQAVEAAGGDGVLLWHGDDHVGAVDAVVLPGGFAHGDYLRPGALARFSPVMDAVGAFARAGGPVIGICNGFQVLTEAGLLPGALQKNGRLRFLCEPARLVVASTSSVLTSGARVGDELVIPINHFSGNYTCDDETLRASRRGTRRAALRRQSQRVGGRHRRRRQRSRQRGRAYAAPRAGQPRVARLGRRPRAVARAGRRGEPAPAAA